MANQTKKQKTKKRRKSPRRRVQEVIACGLIVFSMTLLYTFGLRVMNVYKQKALYDELLVQRDALKQELASLEEQIELLDDPEYVTRYARENYVFTSNGEFPMALP